MPVRGGFRNGDGDEYTYRVVQYKKLSKDYVYRSPSRITRGVLDSSDLDYARIYVARKDEPDSGFYTTMYGPYLRLDIIESELEYLVDEPEYAEL